MYMKTYGSKNVGLGCSQHYRQAILYEIDMNFLIDISFFWKTKVYWWRTEQLVIPPQFLVEKTPKILLLVTWDEKRKVICIHKGAWK